MNKTVSFAKRNLMEMSRDALSYIFCVAFPVVMLIIMSLVNSTIPKESGNTVFQIDSLAGGVAVFGQSFIMLFTALQVATDRGSSFLIRLYASPMKSRNFTNGYILPMLVIALIQGVITHIAAYVNILLYGVIGFSFAFMTFLFDMNRIGLLIQWLLYFLTTAGVCTGITILLWQLHRYPQALISTLCGYSVTYVIMAISQYRSLKRDVAAINEELDSAT